MILIALSIALIAVYCGVSLLAREKKESLGMFYTAMSWFIIFAGFMIMGFSTFKGLKQMGHDGPTRYHHHYDDSIPHGGGGPPPNQIIPTSTATTTTQSSSSTPTTPAGN
jgi:hypothetical protein